MVSQPPPDLDPAVADYYDRAPKESRLELGAEGPGWMLMDFDERWNDPGRREILIQTARALESEPAVMGCSAHLIVVGRKPQT